MGVAEVEPQTPRIDEESFLDNFMQGAPRRKKKSTKKKGARKSKKVIKKKVKNKRK